MPRPKLRTAAAAVSVAGGLVLAGGGVLAGTSVLVAPAAAAGAACVPTGYIAVTDTSTHTSLGYLSNTFNTFGEYVITSNATDELTVTAPFGSRVSITATNGSASDTPFVGGIKGYSSAGPSLGSTTATSANYAYLGGTAHTPAGSAPVKAANSFTTANEIAESVESSIWTLGSHGGLQPQWVNTNGSKPATQLVSEDGILILTGDPTAFAATYGAADPVRLTLVQTSAPCPVTNPSISATVTSAHAKTRYGWYRSPVKVHFTCTRGTAPLTAPCPPNVTFTADTKHRRVARTIHAYDGGVANTAVILKIDRVKPALRISGVRDGANYAHPPRLVCHATDHLSGVATCTITSHRLGQTVSYVATAIDRAGNVERVKGHYTVG